MTETLQFLARHGYAAIFLCVLAEQLGLPIPAGPILLAAGALAGAGRLDFAVAIGLVVAASLIADLLWYDLGRRHGGRVLALLCRITLEPDSCVRRTQETFARRGALSLVIAKFVPGLSTVTPPLAGIIRMKLWRFLAFDSLGILAWALAFFGTGYLLGQQLEPAGRYLAQVRSWAPLLLIGALAAYLGWKYLQRRRFLRDHRLSRITPDELKEKLDAGEPLVVLDLRHALDHQERPEVIPGAVRMSPAELEHRHQEIPRDRDIVLYCT